MRLHRHDRTGGSCGPGRPPDQPPTPDSQPTVLPNASPNTAKSSAPSPVRIGILPLQVADPQEGCGIWGEGCVRPDSEMLPSRPTARPVRRSASQQVRSYYTLHAFRRGQAEDALGEILTRLQVDDDPLRKQQRIQQFEGYEPRAVRRRAKQYPRLSMPRATARRLMREGVRFKGNKD
jgi:hypothetical protein